MEVDEIASIIENDSDGGDSSMSVSGESDNENNISINNGFLELESAFRGNLKTYYLLNQNYELKDISLFLLYHKDNMKSIIQNLLRSYNALKFNILLECVYQRPVTNEIEARNFKTMNKTVLMESDIDAILHLMIQKIVNEESEYEGKGSGWSLRNVDGIVLRFSRYRPFGGSSFLPLPEVIIRKKAVINPKNISDNDCFKWALLSRFVTGSHKERVDQRYKKLVNKFNFNIDFPTPLKQIKKFESLNPTVSVNVYGLNHSNDIYPLRVCQREKCEHFDLLLISNETGNKHYCYIKNMSKLLNSQISKNSHKLSICKRCLAHYQGKGAAKKLEEHRRVCRDIKTPVRSRMPMVSEQNSGSAPSLKFKNHHFSFNVPIVIYCDFECILRKMDVKTTKYTSVDNVHEPMSFGVYVVTDDSLPPEILNQLPKDVFIYQGENADEIFMSHLIELTNKIGDLISVYKPMSPLTDAERIRVESATNCEMCNKDFTLIRRKVRDHCHLSGRFRSILCSDCNLSRQNQRYIPVLMHNSSNYDNHFIIKHLGCDKKEIHVIPNTSEKYVTFSKRTSSGLVLRFIDTYRFLSLSLSKLASNLPKEKFKHTKTFFTENELQLVTRKGVFPYEYCNSFERLNETELPSRDSFYSSLEEKEVDENDYNHAKTVWRHFECKTLGDYSNMYLKIDILLLSDIFENFRLLCMTNYGLDCCHYITLPSLTFDAMLKLTNVELELLTDYDKYIFIEQGIRGGISSCIKRYSKANHPRLKQHYDQSKKLCELVYIDANNLYGWALNQLIPINGFEWQKGDLNTFDILSVPNDSPVGYIIEADVMYPTHLHDLHNDLPFLPVSKCPPGSKQKKLLTTLEHKYNYVCHYMNLKQAVQNGLVVRKIHRILKFNQCKWLAPYIEFNTEKRKHASNTFEKDFYKLCNNAMFGKTIENVRKRVNIELVNKEKRLNKLICKPTFQNRIIYSETLSAVQCSKETVMFNKPIYIGFTVLELSKYLMYNFHYNVILKKYGNNVRLLYVDTDSFLIEFCFKSDFFQEIQSPELKPYFDLSDYPPDHKYYFDCNKKTLGCFKDVCEGTDLLEYIGLRPKLYTIKTVNDEFLEKDKNMMLKKAKGVKKTVIKNHITFSDYKKCLMENVTIRKKMKVIKSKKHCVLTETINKIALSGTDDKRVIQEDGITTLAYGHYKLNVDMQ